MINDSIMRVGLNMLPLKETVFGHNCEHAWISCDSRLNVIII